MAWLDSCLLEGFASFLNTITNKQTKITGIKFKESVWYLKHASALGSNTGQLLKKRCECKSMFLRPQKSSWLNYVFEAF